MAYTVMVGNFEGPFDLLLQLIAQRRVDVNDVALADITDDYLAALRRMDTVDLDATTEFLVIAATLVELKAARLLPDDDDVEIDELAIHARDLLYARLLDFGVFAEAAAFLGGRLADQAGYVPRQVSLEEAFVGCLLPLQLELTPDDVALLYGDVVAAAAERERPVDVSHLPPIPITVEQASELLVSQLAVRGGTASFRTLTSSCASRVEVAVAFLAVLELYKNEQIEVTQATNFGELVVTLATDDQTGAQGSDLAVEYAAVAVRVGG